MAGAWEAEQRQRAEFNSNYDGMPQEAVARIEGAINDPSHLA
jgi:hypothetical protein